MLVRQFSRYLGVQVLAYAVDMGGFLLLSRGFDVGPLAANVAGKLAAGALAFVLHRRVTFAGHAAGDPRAQLLRYGLLLAANVPLSSGLLWLCLPWLHPVVLAKFVADAAGVALTFVLSRELVFRRSRPTAGDGG